MMNRRDALAAMAAELTLMTNGTVVRTVAVDKQETAPDMVLVTLAKHASVEERDQIVADLQRGCTQAGWGNIPVVVQSDDAFVTCYGDWLMADGVHLKTGDVSGSGFGEGFQLKAASLGFVAINTTYANGDRLESQREHVQRTAKEYTSGERATMVGPSPLVGLRKHLDALETMERCMNETHIPTRAERLVDQLECERKAEALIDAQIAKVHTIPEMSEMCDRLHAMAVAFMETMKRPQDCAFGSGDVQEFHAKIAGLVMETFAPESFRRAVEKARVDLK